MRRRPGLTVAVAVALSLAALAASAGSAGRSAIAPGAACSKPGLAGTGVGGVRYVCNRSGAKLVWVKVSASSLAARAGGACPKAGATTGGGQGITLLCRKAGAKLVWKAQKGAAPATGSPATTTPGSSGGSAPAGALPWSPAGNGDWRATGTPPACAITWQLPADLATATSILPPGQVRGGNYKAHGGFRFDDRADSLVTVRAPMSGVLMQGAAYLEDNLLAPTGKPELQYLLDIMNPCGFIVRFDHLKVLAPAIKAAFDANVKVTEDTRTTALPAVQVKAGDVIATAVGHTETHTNVSFDFGVYDLRKKQTTARSAAELQQLGSSLEYAWHGVCWYDLFGAATSARIRALPPTGGNAQSDFCVNVELDHKPDPAER